MREKLCDEMVNDKMNVSYFYDAVVCIGEKK